jgi:hypothetical protein
VTGKQLCRELRALISFINALIASGSLYAISPCIAGKRRESYTIISKNQRISSRALSRRSRRNLYLPTYFFMTLALKAFRRLAKLNQ